MKNFANELDILTPRGNYNSEKAWVCDGYQNGY